MSNPEHWQSLNDAIEFAVSCVVDDVDPLNERELADGNQYIMRILAAISETSLVTVDFENPSFLTMRESVRHLGAAGPDIDYDVAILVPGGRYRVTGLRGDAAYVGLVLYGAGGAEGASSILESADVDDLIDTDGNPEEHGEAGAFTYDIDHPDASRLIVRQYFHDRASAAPGRWEITRLDNPAAGGVGEGRAGRAGRAGSSSLPQADMVGYRIGNGAQMLRWNAQLNQLWTPERRNHPNEFVRLGANDIVAAVPNPDVVYAFTWWRVSEGEALVIEAVPPACSYWAIQLCDRWFQSYPHRHTNLNDQQVEYRKDGSVRFVIAAEDPGVANWLDTSGHATGVVFFRWLHDEPAALPTCRVVPLLDAADS